MNNLGGNMFQDFRNAGLGQVGGYRMAGEQKRYTREGIEKAWQGTAILSQHLQLQI